MAVSILIQLHRCDRAPLWRAVRPGPCRTRTKLAAHVRPCRKFPRTRAATPGLRRHEQRLEAGICIDLQLAFEARPDASADILPCQLGEYRYHTAGGSVEPHRSCRRERRSTADLVLVLPVPGASTLIGVSSALIVRRRQHVLGQGRHQGAQQLAAGADPLHEGRAAQGHAGVGEDLALPIQRQMETRTSSSSTRARNEAPAKLLLDRTGGRRRLHDA